jgi:cytokinin riboside 5'-monophosphate phosphoribohydrolase
MVIFHCVNLKYKRHIKKGMGFEMNKSICVYCSSSDSIREVYFECAKSLGIQIGKRGDTLIYGGAKIGLMGAIAKAVQDNNGKVIGVLPNQLNQQEIVNPACDELIITDNMREKKLIMELKSDAFIALPGAFGTLEELLEIITAKTLKLIDKPIVILNVENFYEGLLKQIDTVFHDKFASRDFQNLYMVTNDVEKALDYIDSCTLNHHCN